MSPELESLFMKLLQAALAAIEAYLSSRQQSS